MPKQNDPAAKNERIYRLKFGDVYPLYIKKAERKGRTKDEVDEIVHWFTGYSEQDLKNLILNETDFEAFFAHAPRMNPNETKITGAICGYRVEDIEDKIIQRVRYLDKLIDELANGRAMERILRT